jgi:hypothetical protein
MDPVVEVYQKRGKNARKKMRAQLRCLEAPPMEDFSETPEDLETVAQKPKDQIPPIKTPVLPGRPANQKPEAPEKKEPTTLEEYFETLNPTENDTVVTFSKASKPFGFLSPQFPCRFQDESGNEYISVEQYVLRQKAFLFKDTNLIRRVMEAKTTRELKAVDVRVQNFDPSLWDEEKVKIMVVGNMLKFSQNRDLGQKLVSTMLASKQGSFLAFISPTDKIWGTGTESSNPLHWKGENLLGKAMMMVRARLVSKLFEAKEGVPLNLPRDLPQI